MDQVLKNRMWGFIVGILVVANIATLAGFWYIKFHSDKPVAATDLPRGQANTKAFIIAQLGFNAVQQKNYGQLVQQHRQNVGRIQEELREAKDVFFNSVAHPETTQAQLEALSSNIANYEKQLDMLTYQHFKQVRALCNDEQKAKFDNIIKQVMRMMGPAGGGRPQGPPPRGQGGDLPPPPPDGQGPPPGQEGPPQQ